MRAAAVAVALVTGAARAQETSAGGAALPVAAELRAFCTDRPTKANLACTVDQGHFQIEVDAVDGATSTASGVTTDIYVLAAPTLKYGVTDTVDLEASFAPATVVRNSGPAAAASRTLSGIGDLYLRAKVSLADDPAGRFDAAILPFVKAPTARAGIGNGAWEGGVIAPLVFKLKSDVYLTLDPEVDLLKNDYGDGRHLGMAQIVNLSWEVSKTVTLLGELWSDVDFKSHGTVVQYSADLALTRALAHDVQLDIGVNLGLNRDTPALQAYAGVSRRF